MAALCACAIARPTAFAKPCPSGPVVTSIPGVSCDSGWPGVMLSTCCRWSQYHYNTEDTQTYSERLQVVHADAVAKEVEKGILQHTAMAVAACC